MENDTNDLDFTVGRWVIYPAPSAFSYTPRLEALRIEAVTEKLVRGVTHTRWAAQLKKADVLVTVATEDEARALIAKSAGVHGEMERRIKAARDWAKTEAAKLVAPAGQSAA